MSGTILKSYTQEGATFSLEGTRLEEADLLEVYLPSEGWKKVQVSFTGLDEPVGWLILGAMCDEDGNILYPKYPIPEDGQFRWPCGHPASRERSLKKRFEARYESLGGTACGTCGNPSVVTCEYCANPFCRECQTVSSNMLVDNARLEYFVLANFMGPGNVPVFKCPRCGTVDLDLIR